MESLKSTPNNTNINNTNNINTDNINMNINSNQFNSVDEFNKRIELNGIENNRKSILEIKEEVIADFRAEQTLPYIYTDIAYHRHLKQAIYSLTEYEWYKKASEDGSMGFGDRSKNEDLFSTVHIFNEALYKMLSTDGIQNIGRRNLTYSKIYDQLVQHIKDTAFTNYKTGTNYNKLLIRDLMSNTIENYQTASKINKIKYPVPYMMTCILTAMENGEAKINDLIRYDFQ